VLQFVAVLYVGVQVETMW